MPTSDTEGDGEIMGLRLSGGVEVSPLKEEGSKCVTQCVKYPSI